MNNKYLKIYELINKSTSYVYKEKHKEWHQFIIRSILNNTPYAEIVIDSMELLENNESTSFVLDYIYQTRLNTETILYLIDIIFNYYKDGPKFKREAYHNFITENQEQEILLVEKQNKVYQKRQHS